METTSDQNVAFEPIDNIGINITDFNPDAKRHVLPAWYGFVAVADTIGDSNDAVSDVYNPSVPLLCGATYYLAEPVCNLLVSRYHKRNRAAALADFVGRSYEVELAPAGVTQRTVHFKYTMEWPGIEQVTVDQSVMFMWTSDRQAIVVPLRAVPEQDRSRAIDIAKSRGASQRQADLPSRRDRPTAMP